MLISSISVYKYSCLSRRFLHALFLQLAAEAKAREEALAKEQNEEAPEEALIVVDKPEESQGQENETPDGKQEKRQWRKGKRVTKTPKQRTPKPKPVREPQPQDEETRMSASAEDSQQGKTDNTPRKRVMTMSLILDIFY